MNLNKLREARDGLWSAVETITYEEMGLMPLALPQLREAARVAHASALKAWEDCVRLAAMQEAWDARYGPDGEPT